MRVNVDTMKSLRRVVYVVGKDGNEVMYVLNYE